MLATTLLPAAGLALAQDVVFLSSKDHPASRTKMTGKVIEYTGRQLVLELPGGNRQTFPGERVVYIKTDFSAEHGTADELLAQHDFRGALAQYQLALRTDERHWVRRLIIARIVHCYTQLTQWDRAGEYFLLLVRDDPATPYFDTIPLAWLPTQPTLALEQKAREWMARNDLPVAALLGATHLLSTGQRSKALERLRHLSADADSRVALLAEAQSWRGTFATAGDEQLDRWSETIERMPEALQAGPYLVLGRALAQHRRFEEAAAALLRVPILYPEQRTLAAAGLLAGGQMLERLDRPEAAARLYRELVALDADARTTAEAKQRLDEVQQALEKQAATKK